MARSTHVLSVNSGYEFTPDFHKGVWLQRDVPIPGQVFSGNWVLGSQEMCDYSYSVSKYNMTMTKVDYRHLSRQFRFGQGRRMCLWHASPGSNCLQLSVSAEGILSARTWISGAVQSTLVVWTFNGYKYILAISRLHSGSTLFPQKAC